MNKFPTAHARTKALLFIKNTLEDTHSALIRNYNPLQQRTMGRDGFCVKLRNRKPHTAGIGTFPLILSIQRGAVGPTPTLSRFLVSVWPGSPITTLPPSSPPPPNEFRPMPRVVDDDGGVPFYSFLHSSVCCCCSPFTHTIAHAPGRLSASLLFRMLVILSAECFG